MKNRILGVVVLLGASMFTGCETEQPGPQCNVPHIWDFSAKYILRPGSVTGGGTCDRLPGEALGVGSFYDPAQKNTPPFALRPEALVYRVPYVAGSVPEASLVFAERPVSVTNGTGNFQSLEPNAEGFCTVASLTSSTSEVGAGTAPDPTNVGEDEEGEALLIDEDQAFIEFTPAVPTSDTPVYAFSDIQVYTTPIAAGTQLTAALTYSEGSCSATYDVVAMYPAIHCSDGAPPGPDGLFNVDPSLCEPETNPDEDRFIASGINPSFDTCCSRKTGYCVLKADEVGEATLTRTKGTPIGICD